MATERLNTRVGAKLRAFFDGEPSSRHLPLPSMRRVDTLFGR